MKMYEYINWSECWIKSGAGLSITENGQFSARDRSRTPSVRFAASVLTAGYLKLEYIYRPIYVDFGRGSE
jgi:hypothetical protein